MHWPGRKSFPELGHGPEQYIADYSVSGSSSAARLAVELHLAADGFGNGEITEKTELQLRQRDLIGGTDPGVRVHLRWLLPCGACRIADSVTDDMLRSDAGIR